MIFIHEVPKTSVGGKGKVSPESNSCLYSVAELGGLSSANH